MKQLIINKIEELGENVSFVDLEDLAGFAGDTHLGMPEHNCVYWTNVSEAVVRAIHELARDGVVEFEPTSPQTYAIDGCVLPFPLFEDVVKYDSPRWLPVVLNKGPNFYQDQVSQDA